MGHGKGAVVKVRDTGSAVDAAEARQMRYCCDCARCLRLLCGVQLRQTILN